MKPSRSSHGTRAAGFSLRERSAVFGLVCALAMPFAFVLSGLLAAQNAEPTDWKVGRTDQENGGSSRIGRATAGVLGSKHDFSELTGRAIDACAACHVPHTQTVEPRTTPEGQSVLEFYKMAGEREVFDPDRYTPGPTSLICLSCHNGVIASSTVGSAHAVLAGVRSGFELPEGVPQRDHPIGVPYPAARDYRPKSVILSEGRIPLPEGRVECISCHDPHDERRLRGMLVMSNRRSALCLACHIK